MMSRPAQRSSVRPLAAAMLACALAVLAGCADMGKIEPQAVALKPAELNAGRAIANASADVAWPTEAWWESLHDQQLNQLIATATSDSPSLRAAMARVRQAEALAGVARAGTLPRVDASASMDRELYTGNGAIPAALAGKVAWKNTAQLSGSYDLDLWGRNRDALAAALNEVRMASAESQMARLTLETAIVRAYIQLSLDYALQDSVAENLQQRQRILAITQQRRAAGLASEMEVANIETTLPSGRREHEQIGESIALLRNQLAALIGRGPGDGESIARPQLTLEAGVGQQVPSTLPAQLLGRRPDIVAQRWRVEAANARIAGAKADFYPNVNLAAFVGLQSLGFPRFLESHAKMAGVTPAISLPIFEGGRLRSQLGNQTAIYDIAVEQYNGAVIQAMSDVANALVRIESVKQQDQLAQRALTSARRQQELAERAYKAGMTDSLNVINAQLTLLNEQQQMAQVASKQLDNYALLMTALGGGVKLD